MMRLLMFAGLALVAPIVSNSWFIVPMLVGITGVSASGFASIRRRLEAPEALEAALVKAGAAVAEGEPSPARELMPSLAGS